jgi:hypothetical protein
MIMSKAWERLERLMRWSIRRGMGGCQARGLRRIMNELYSSEMMKRDMKGPGDLNPWTCKTSIRLDELSLA